MSPRMLEMPKQKKTKYEQLLEMLPERKVILELKDYQKDCVAAIVRLPSGARALIVMPTGTGKTVTFSSIPEKGKILILSMGRDIVYNALQYYPDYRECAVEMPPFNAKKDFPNARIVSASVPTLVNRLKNYRPDEFDLIIVDEAHHSTAPTYRKCLEYFKPKRLLGFTATPNRTDGVGLGTIFTSICFSRDIQWAIQNGHLCDIYLRQIQLNDVDLRRLTKKINAETGETDFDKKELIRAFANSAPAIASIYKEYSAGPTLIYVAGVPLAEKLAEIIPKAKAITGKTDPTERERVLKEFNQGKIPCLVSVDALKEGVDLPPASTLIFCRPTLSKTLYIQTIGRGLRPYPGKEYLNLIEVHGIIDQNMDICTATSLVGLDLKDIPPQQRSAFQGRRISELQEIMDRLLNTDPTLLNLSSETASRWAENTGYDLMDVNWLMRPDGWFEVRFPDATRENLYRLQISPPDALGKVIIGPYRVPMQIALDLGWKLLNTEYLQSRKIWNRKERAKAWGGKPISEKQAALIRYRMPDKNIEGMTRGEADEIIKNLLARDHKDENIVDIPLLSDGNPPEHCVTTEEETVINGKECIVQEVYPDGWKYKTRAKKSTISKAFTAWLCNSLDRIYMSCGQDLDKLIERANASNKERYGILFLRTAEGEQYRYIDTLDGRRISRREFQEWLGKLADVIIPRYIDVTWLNPKEGVYLSQVHPSMGKGPLVNYKFSYPESRRILKSGRSRTALPKTASEIKEANAEEYLDAKRKKEKAASVPGGDTA